MRTTTPTLVLVGAVCGWRELTSSLYAVDLKITKTVKDHNFTATWSVIFRNKDLIREAKRLNLGDIIQARTEPWPVTYEKNGVKVFKIDFNVRELAVLHEADESKPQSAPTLGTKNDKDTKVSQEDDDYDPDLSIDDLYP